VGQNTDPLARLLAYIFAADIREHPMPPWWQQGLLQEVQRLLAASGEGETDIGKEQTNGTGGAGATG
jgi:hypothetical protein